jgi:hypothetical protein
MTEVTEVPRLHHPYQRLGPWLIFYYSKLDLLLDLQIPPEYLLTAFFSFSIVKATLKAGENFQP